MNLINVVPNHWLHGNKLGTPQATSILLVLVVLTVPAELLVNIYK